MLAIEIDGSQHTGLIAYDAERSAFLECKGFKVIRFWNREVLAQTDRVREAAAHRGVDSIPHPLPPPVGRGNNGVFVPSWDSPLRGLRSVSPPAKRSCAPVGSQGQGLTLLGVPRMQRDLFSLARIFSQALSAPAGGATNAAWASGIGAANWAEVLSQAAENGDDAY